MVFVMFEQMEKLIKRKLFPSFFMYMFPNPYWCKDSIRKNITYKRINLCVKTINYIIHIFAKYLNQRTEKTFMAIHATELSRM